VPRSARSLRWEAAATAAVAVLVIVALWVVLIRIEPGRRFENVVWESRTILARRLRLGHDSALRFIDETTIALGLFVVVAIGVVRRRLLLGLVVAVAVAGASVTSQVLKRWVVTRPPTVGELASISGNSFPSGHATICTALGLAVLVMVPRRWRRVATLLVAVWVVVQSVGVLASGWHRPSDALAGIAVAAAWTAAAIWVIARSGRVVADDGDLPPPAGELHVAGGALLVGVAALVVSAAVGGETPVSAGGVAYLASSALIVLAGIATVWWFWFMLRDWTLDAHPIGPTDDGVAPVGRPNGSDGAQATSS